MKANYRIECAFPIPQQATTLIICNYPNQNLISQDWWCGVVDKKRIFQYAIGIWKIKKLKQ